MKQYIGLDVSLKETHICVVGRDGTVQARGREAARPEMLAATIGPITWQLHAARMFRRTSRYVMPALGLGCRQRRN